MSVSELLNQRSSTRAFKSEPVPSDLIEKVFSLAQRSPSNCNVQPWQCKVVSGNTRDALSNALVERVITGEPANPDFDWTVRYEGIHRDRQFEAAATLYNAMGIERSDRSARNQAMLRNWQFFGAPHAVFFVMDKYMSIMGAVDLGIYAQTLALIMEEHGIQCCMQGALGQFPAPVREQLSIPEHQGVLFGMSFGYSESDAAPNKAKTDRAPLSNSVEFFY